MTVWIKSGTVAVTNGSATVQGTGTGLYGKVAPGYAFVGPDGRIYEVLSVNLAEQITLASPYLGATASGAAYAIYPTLGLAAQLVVAVQALITGQEAVQGTIFQGLFPGDVAFEADPDTGMGRPSDNEVALRAGNVWQLRLKDGVASGAAVQASSTDATIGRLMKVGAFGLGVGDGANAPDIVDMDTAPSGLGRISGATIGAKPTGVTSGSVLTLVNQSGRSSQFVFRAASNRVYVRTKHDDVWRAFSEIYCAENLLGTVARSGSVPTGAVIERGSNASGEYVRFADGTQICLLESVGMAATSAIGSIFRTSADANWSFPAAFLSGSTPACFGRVTGASRWVSFGGGNHISAGFRQYSALSDATLYPAQLCAIGRWF